MSTTGHRTLLTRLAQLGAPRRGTPADRSADRAEQTPLIDLVRDELADRELVPPTPADIAAVLSDVPSHDHRTRAGVEEVRTLTREFSGLGDLAVPLCDPDVTDVLLNGPGPVWIDRGHGVEPTGLTVADAASCRSIAVRLAAACGSRLDDSHPFADGIITDLPPGVAGNGIRGVRVHALLDPPAGNGACVSLRVLSQVHRDLAALRGGGMFGAEVHRRLLGLIDGRRSFLVSGGTGAGKTTLLSAMLAQVPADQRLLLVEDTPELFPDHGHVVGLRTREAGPDGAGGIDMRMLVRQSLRMRPDRIIVGEIRGEEIAELLLAFNTGHGGSAGTVHANSLQAVPGRLTALGALAGMPAETVARQVVDGVDTVIHVDRISGSGGAAGQRRITQIGRLCGGDGRVAVETEWEWTC